MASLQFVFLALFAVSAYGLVPAQPYSTLQTYPVQNGYAFFYTAQLPLKTQPLSYPGNYVAQRQYYTPYYYQQQQPKETVVVQKVTLPPQGYFAQKEQQRGQFVPNYAQKEAQQYQQFKEQKVNYPAEYTPVYQDAPQVQKVQYQVPVGYVEQNVEQNQKDQKLNYPFNYPVYQEQQQEVQTYPSYYPYQYQAKDDQPKVFYPFARYQEQQQYPSAYPGYYAQQEQNQEYVYQPTVPQGYQQYQAYPYSRVYSDVYAPRYPENYYSAQQEQPAKQDKTSKRIGKPTIHVKKYDDNMLGDEDYEKNYVKVDQLKH